MITLEEAVREYFLHAHNHSNTLCNNKKKISWGSTEIWLHQAMHIQAYKYILCESDDPILT